MKTLDWIIVTIYAFSVIIMGWCLGKRQKGVDDYFLAGRSLPWWAIGISTMATQLSAISFISAPAFVGLRPGGGLVWLGYEFAVPFALIPLMHRIIPTFHQLRIISIYQYLEFRFNKATRRFVSIIFQISRALATGVGIYAGAIVMSVALEIPLFFTICLIGIIALIYDYMGGMRAVVFSDVLQMLILFIGIIICMVFGLHYIGGWQAVGNLIPPERLSSLRLDQFGVGSRENFGFLPLFFGGFFLYIAYYGFDQSQVQREISAKTVNDSRRSLVLNAILRYPLVLSYCLLGLILGTYIIQDPSLIELLPGGKPDYLVPVFIVHRLPAGVVGFIVVAILAASMSSLDSSINSLSAATVEDMIKPVLKRPASRELLLRCSKISTIFWGIFCTSFAFFVENISPTIIEAINKIGSIFYGPIAGVFLLGIYTRKGDARGALTGGLCGIIINLSLAFGLYPLSWLWWNLIGSFTTLGVGILVSSKKSGKKRMPDVNLSSLPGGQWNLVYLLIACYGAGIILFTAFIDKILF